MKITNKTLFQKCPSVDFANKHALFLLSQQMLKFMEQQGGIGLAANQVGKNQRMFVMNVKSPKVCINPEVIEQSSTHEEGYEGCLSYKGQYVFVDRPTDITVKYQNWQGEFITEQLSGLEARCFLHELDHLDGITMHKRKVNVAA